MQIHASCAAREGHGILLTGPPGVGKSSLLLRLLRYGFILVADDRVEVDEGIARPPIALAGLLEVRGVGIVRLPYLAEAKLSLKLCLGEETERLPMPCWDTALNLPELVLNPHTPDAADRAAIALSCATGNIVQHSGAFAP